MELTNNIAYNAQIWRLSMDLAEQDFKDQHIGDWDELSKEAQENWAYEFRSLAKVALSHTKFAVDQTLRDCGKQNTDRYLIEQGYQIS